MSAPGWVGIKGIRMSAISHPACNEWRPCQLQKDEKWKDRENGVTTHATEYAFHQSHW